MGCPLVGTLNHFYIKAEWSKSVVATDHGAHGILHPAVVKIAFAFGEGFNEFTHRRPCRRAHPFGAFYFKLFGNDLFLKGQSKSRSCKLFDLFHRLNDFMHKRINAPIVNQLNKTLIESILVSMSGFAMLIIQWKNSAIWNIIILQKRESSSGLSIPRKLKGFVIISGLSFIDFDFRIANISQEKGTIQINRKNITLLSPI